MVHLHNKILLSDIRNKIMPFEAIWIKLEILILRKVRKRKTNTVMTSFICGI